MKEEVFRNTCPRDCYGTCSMLSYVINGKLAKVKGDPKHGFTQGKLCAKGYAYTQFVYNPYRLRFPMIQQPRGSGNWKRITWEEAYSIIAGKIIELQKRYGSSLACAYNKYLGNTGILHYAVEGMFHSIGPHTKLIGNPCSLSGEMAIYESLGRVFSADPENMSNAKLIILWGTNPAVTNVHQMKFIYQARQRGATVVCIDPIFTKTAQKADIFIQIKPGSDVLLANAIAKLLIENGNDSADFVHNQTVGWEEYYDYVKKVNFDIVCERTGVSMEAIRKLAGLYGRIKPSATWCGIGIQRNKNGRNSIRAINSLVALTGNLIDPIEGTYYTHLDIKEFPNHLLNLSVPDNSYIQKSRELNIANFSSEAIEMQDPPIKLLWVASANPLSQDHNFFAWKKLLRQLELIVTVDLFLTETAKQSDIVLPAATHFEEEDLNVGFWHHWISFNQKAINPYFEAKSDLQIARELSKKLNDLSPGFSSFPFEKEPIDWIKEELSPKIKSLYSIKGYEDLLDGPRKKTENYICLKKDYRFHFSSQKSTFFHEDQEETAEQISQNDSDFYRLLTPQSLLRIHSQFDKVPWLNIDQSNRKVEISIDDAKRHGIDENSKIEIYTDDGSVIAKPIINPYLPKNIVVIEQAGDLLINQIIHLKSKKTSGLESSNYYDCIVKMRKWRDMDA